jgi:hypothetical protein
MSNNTTTQHDNDYTDEIDYEELIPSKYKNIDDQQFEKFTKRNDWD